MATASPDAQTKSRSHSISDSERSEHERKRPRLSAKPTEEEILQMRKDRVINSTRRTPDQNMIKSTAESASEIPVTLADQTFRNIITSPTSKVTINTRPLSSQSQSRSIPRSNAASPSHEKPSQYVAVTDGATDPHRSRSRTMSPQPSPQAQNNEQDAISISSSNEDDLEIEIAEVEDFDQDPARTRWTSRYGGKRSNKNTVVPNYVYHTFPFADQRKPGHASAVIKNLQKAFQNGAENDGDLFRRAQVWIKEFTDCCDEITHSLICEDPDFWQALPDLTEALIRRDLGVPAKARPQDLMDYFTAYGKLTCLMMEYDMRQFSKLENEDDPKLFKEMQFASTTYMTPFAWMLFPRVPLYEALHRHHNLNVSTFIHNLINQLMESSKIPLISSVSAVLDAVGHVLPHKASTSKSFIDLLIITDAMSLALERSPRAMETMSADSTAGLDLLGGISDIVFKAESILSHAVEKQLPWLNMDIARAALEKLALIFKRVGVQDHEVGRKVYTSAGLTYSDADAAHLDDTLEVAWRFKFLMKFMKSGRMELRVFAVEAMSTELVGVFQKYIHDQTSRADQPIVQFLVRFIRETNLISYIVGVDSHPQLIQRSHNIGGFLCVAEWYTDQDTDTIWRAVLDGQDPRTTAEILALLQRMFSMYNSTCLHYLCQKIIELPFARYDLKMHQFTANLLETLSIKANSLLYHQQQRLHPAPRRLCIRLLREASTPVNISTEVALFVRRDIIIQLQNLLRAVSHTGFFLATDRDEETSLLQEIRSNLLQHNDHASGDIQIVTCVVQHLYDTTVKPFVRTLDFKKLFVDDLAALSLACQNLDRQGLQTKICEFEVRLICLFYLITTLPNDVDENFMESLWNSLYTNPLVPETSRAVAWNHLATIMKQSYRRNSFVDCIITEYLPRLHPQDYNLAILDFAEHSVQYEIKYSDLEMGGNSGVITIPGMDRIWKFVLEAPANTVESSAINFIIKQYLDNPVVAGRSRASINATHASLVDHSVLQVIQSATRLQAFTTSNTNDGEEQIDDTVGGDEIHYETQRFDRSLFFLRRLLEGLKARPQYSPIQTDIKSILPEFTDKKDDLFDLKLQIRGSHLPSSPLTLNCGTANTGSELWQYLAKTIESNDFGAYHMGQRLNLEHESKTLDELKLTGGMILINRAPSTQTSKPSIRSTPQTSVDEQVMNHFESLYKLLDAHDRLAGEVYSFLTLFPAQTEPIAEVRTMTKTAEQLLPPQKPFKALYGLRALRTCMEVESFSSNPDTTLLVYGMQTIVDTISNLQFSASQSSIHRDFTENLIECLLLGFRARVGNEISRAYIGNCQSFVKQLLHIWEEAMQPQQVDMDHSSISNTIRGPFDALLEGSLHDQRVLSMLKTDSKFPTLLRFALLGHSNAVVRSTNLELIYGLTGGTLVKSMTKENDSRRPKSRFPSSTIEECLELLWSHLKTYAPDACAQPLRSQAFLEAMLTVLKRLRHTFSVEQVHGYYRQWADLLLGHEPVEKVGQSVSDCVVLNLPKLLLECVKLLCTARGEFRDRTLVIGLFSRYLYPPLSAPEAPQSSKLPVLDGLVRQNLFDLILALSPATEDLLYLISELDDDLVPDDTFEPGLVHERSCVRSEAGYAGLRNLSNTCYLNSLVSQLFMNVGFRDFILRENIIDESRQRLLSELGKVFANMQSSYEKFVDPSFAVDSITTYDGDQIDVAVQMDVDEFFNLLFDRLEGQILDPQQRQKFKSMYGGQLVQQVKSKECDHISERLEPFSAVQVEIKGKQTLEDSLKAYVAGEVLQGDNKYSCTSCGRHVDAVKRACLKDIPDNLIFNLKRFDYDIMTGIRCKVNDEFQFPETLNMAPYTLQHLSQPGAATEPDLFELTGIIVHSGTADSGHYYSFIRQRPSVRSKTEAWVQFNDQEVTPFDPAQIQDCCFGGTDTSTAYYMAKFYSAYMLFYQRVDSIQRAEQMYAPSDVFDTAKVELSPDIETHLQQQNELFLRIHCIQDPSHARFVKQLLERIHSNNTVGFGDDHRFEDQVLETVLNHIFQISSRWKGLPDFEETLAILGDSVVKCSKCAATILRWLTNIKVIEGMIVKSPYQVVRKCIATLLCLTLTTVCRSIPQESESPSSSGSTDGLCMTRRQYEDLVEECLMYFYKLWENMTRISRSWPEYFQVLQHCLTKLSDEEGLILIDQGFLERSLEVMMIHCPYTPEVEIPKRWRNRYSAYLAAREKGRGFPHALIVRFIASMLPRIDFNAHPDDRTRRQHENQVSTTSVEFDLLGLARSPYFFEWLRRIIVGNSNPPDTRQIVAYISRQRRIMMGIFFTISRGLNDRVIANAVLFLHPALAFVENCSNQVHVIDLAQAALEGIATTSVDFSKDYVEFVTALTTCENRFVGGERGWLKDIVLENINSWAPPLLISPHDRDHDVKKEIIQLLQRLLLEPIFEAQQNDLPYYAVLQNYVHKFVSGAQDYIQINIFDADSKAETMVLPTQAHSLSQVVSHCLQYYDAHDPVQADKVSEVESCLQMLKTRAEITSETMSATEWAETSSDIAEVSEPDVEDIISP